MTPPRQSQMTTSLVEDTKPSPCLEDERSAGEARSEAHGRVGRVEDVDGEELARRKDPERFQIGDRVAIDDDAQRAARREARADDRSAERSRLERPVSGHERGDGVERRPGPRSLNARRVDYAARWGERRNGARTVSRTT